VVLWTVLPIELVLRETEHTPAFEEIDYSGIKLMIEKISPLQGRVVRLLSTEPQDFLRPEIQPGVLLSYMPVLGNL
jgi:hypothetical protein